jgi:hypothetical protein
MRNALALMIAALAGIAVPVSGGAQANERWPDIPGEQGVRLVGRVGWLPYRCSEAPVTNFYHDALYDEPPAVYLGYAYRPHYRYTAWRISPRTYLCSGGRW